MTLEERFWSKVDKSDSENACWNWIAFCAPNGYGQFGVNGKVLYAHRVVWEISNGNIPNNMCVLHRCDNPPCCNPAHLFLGTQVDNILDMRAKKREKFALGENVGISKLTRKQVLEIRDKYVYKIYGSGLLSKEYGVSTTQIWHIVHRKVWSWL